MSNRSRLYPTASVAPDSIDLHNIVLLKSHDSDTAFVSNGTDTAVEEDNADSLETRGYPSPSLACRELVLHARCHE